MPQAHISVSNYVDIKSQAEKLGVNIPKDLAIIPSNFAEVKRKEDLYYENNDDELRELWTLSGIPHSKIETSDDHFSSLVKFNDYWWGPTILIGMSMLTENPNVIAVALNIISNYAYDLLKRFSKEGTRFKTTIAIVNLIIEDPKKGNKKLTYEGPIEGLSELPKIIDSLKETKKDE